MVKYQEEQVQWFTIAEERMDNFMAAAERASQRGSKKK